jgi:hypothetical protein
VSDAKQAAMIAMLSARPGASSEAIIAESLNFAAAAQIQKGQARPKWNPTVKKVRPKEAYTAMQMPGLFEGFEKSTGGFGSSTHHFQIINNKCWFHGRLIARRGWRRNFNALGIGFGNGMHHNLVPCTYQQVVRFIRLYKL